MPCSVFLLDETMPVPAADLGKAVQAVLGGVAYDHVRAINVHHGWIARGLEDGQARELVAELRGAGHEAIRRDEQGLLGIESVARVRRAELREDALSVEVGLLGKLTRLPWSSLSLVSIGRVQVTQQKTVKQTKRKLGLSRAGLAMGVPMPTVKRTTKTHVETQVDDSLVLQLVFAEEGVLREIRPSGFDYSYLGDRLLPTSRENFGVFLQDLLSFGGDAAWTAMARGLAEGGQPPHTFKGDKDLLRFTQWRLEVTLGC